MTLLVLKYTKIWQISYNTEHVYRNNLYESRQLDCDQRDYFPETEQPFHEYLLKTKFLFKWILLSFMSNLLALLAYCILFCREVFYSALNFLNSFWNSIFQKIYKNIIGIKLRIKNQQPLKCQRNSSKNIIIFFLKLKTEFMFYWTLW